MKKAKPAPEPSFPPGTIIHFEGMNQLVMDTCVGEFIKVPKKFGPALRTLALPTLRHGALWGFPEIDTPLSEARVILTEPTDRSFWFEKALHRIDNAVRDAAEASLQISQWLYLAAQDLSDRRSKPKNPKRAKKRSSPYRPAHELVPGQVVGKLGLICEALKLSASATVEFFHIPIGENSIGQWKTKAEIACNRKFAVVSDPVRRFAALAAACEETDAYLVKMTILGVEVRGLRDAKPPRQ